MAYSPFGTLRRLGPGVFAYAVATDEPAWDNDAQLPFVIGVFHPRNQVFCCGLTKRLYRLLNRRERGAQYSQTGDPSNDTIDKSSGTRQPIF